MSNSESEDVIRLLTKCHIEEFNRWRINNPTTKLVISGIDFLRKDLSGAYFNGIISASTNFSHCNLVRINLVQADLSNANFEGANLTDAILMYAEMKGCNLTGADLTRTNLMWANLQDSNLTGCKLSKTVLVQANLMNAKLENVYKNGAYLKFAKLKGTLWETQEAEDGKMHPQK
jgi:uncharacterized protein YjbI with pentapeptide repeats